MKESDSGDYPVKVTLSDSVTKLKTVNRFNITLIVPPESQRVPSTETEVFRAFEGAPTAPDFYALEKSLDGANAYDVATTTLYDGLSSSLTYSTFPTLSVGSSTATKATSVLLATYASNTAQDASAAQAAASSAPRSQSLTPR